MHSQNIPSAAAHTSNVEFLSSCFIQGSCVFVSWGIEPTLGAPFRGLSTKLFYLRWFCPGFVEELVLSPIDAFHGFGSAAPHLSMNKYHVVRLGWGDLSPSLPPAIHLSPNPLFPSCFKSPSWREKFWLRVARQITIGPQSFHLLFSCSLVNPLLAPSFRIGKGRELQVSIHTLHSP